MDPAHAVVNGGPATTTPSRAASVVSNVVSVTKPASVAKTASAKASSKAPSKVVSELGGLMGLFDGAADDDFGASYDGPDDYDPHGFPRRSPSYVERRPPPPDYRWDTLRGGYRHLPPLHRSPDQFRRVYEDEFHSLDVHPPEDSPPGNNSERGDMVFIEESAGQIGQLVMQGTECAKRYTIMEREANMHRYEPDVFSTMARALQRKAQDITSINQEINSLYRSIDACMRRMDKNDFQQMRSFLHQQHVYPEIQIELATPLPTPTPRRVSPQSPQTPAISRLRGSVAKAGWQDVGSGKTRKSLAERKQQGLNHRDESDAGRRSPPRSQKSNEDMDGVAKWTGNVQEDDIWETTSAKKISRNGRWHSSPAQDSSRRNISWNDTPANWNDTPGKSSSRHDKNAWGNSSGSVHSAKKSQKPQKGGGWSSDKSSVSKPPGAWPATPNKSGESWSQQGEGQDTGSWGGGGACDNIESKSNNNGAGWSGDGNDDGGSNAWVDQADAHSEKQDDSNHGWGATGDDNAKADSWGGGDDPSQNNQSQASQKSTSQWGHGNQSKNNDETGAGDKPANDDHGGGDWGNVQKTRSRTKSTQQKVKSKAADNSWGSDGAQSKLKDNAVATTVSAIRPVIKPYWQVWDKPAEEEKKPRTQPRDAYVYPAPPSIAAPPGKPPSVSHGVQAGRGANYTHKLHQPEYLDTMQEPYAIFTFKYRSKAAVEKILKKKIDTSNVQQAVKEVEAERLRRLPKDELVAELMRRQMMMSSSSNSSNNSSNSNSSAPSSRLPSYTSKLREDDNNGEKEKKASSRKKSPSNKSGWGVEVKPSDSVSNVAASRASRASKKVEKEKVDDWQQVGQGEVATSWHQKEGGSRASKAKTEEHWNSGDADMKQAGGGIW